MQLRGHRIGQYHILNLLKKGGMGTVYLADDEFLHRRVAIKVIWTDVSHYDNITHAQEAIRLFLHEAQILARFDHQHILPIYDSGEDQYRNVYFMYLVMPYRHEGSLSDWLYKYHPVAQLSIWDIHHIIQQAASALQHAHNLDIIHQDVKASNFLIHGTANFPGQLELQLADFGIAKLMTTTSKTQEIRGTPLYMAPEQWDNHPVPATDQYALAILAYELLTGQPPFTGSNKNQLWHQHNHIQPSPPSSFNQQIPANLDSVILKALAKSPRDRFDSITAFSNAFQQAILNNGLTYRTRSLVADAVSPAKPLTIERTVPIFQPPDLHPPNLHPPDPPQHHRFLRWFLLCIVLILLVASGGLLYLTRVYQQNVIIGLTATAHAQLTTNNQTLIVNKTNRANTDLTNTAQISETNTAIAHATATQNFNLTQTAIAASATASTNATGTAWAAITSGVLKLNDPLHDNSLNNNWDSSPVGPNDNGCEFVDGAYHASVNQLQTSIQPCFAGNTDFTNCTFQVTMNIISGDQGGILFRGNETNGTFYYFYINTNGAFGLSLFNHDVFQRTLKSDINSAVLKGVKQPNVITVKIVNFTFSLYINKTLVATITDSQADQNSFGHGAIGVVAEATGNSTDIAFSNAQVWQP